MSAIHNPNIGTIISRQLSFMEKLNHIFKCRCHHSQSHGNNLKDTISVCIIARSAIVRYYSFRDMIVEILAVYM